MIVKSYQTAYHREGAVKIRLIDVPEDEPWETDEQLLEAVFRFGQNDFQPQPDRYSLSVGDVVDLGDGKLFRCLGAGWASLAPDDDPTALTGKDARMTS